MASSPRRAQMSSPLSEGGQPLSGTVRVATLRETDCDPLPPSTERACAYTPLGVRVEIVALDGSGRRETLRTARDGFGFRSLPAGRYELRPRSTPRTRKAKLQPPRAQPFEISAEEEPERDVILLYRTYRRIALSPPNHQIGVKRCEPITEGGACHI